MEHIGANVRNMYIARNLLCLMMDVIEIFPVNGCLAGDKNLIPTMSRSDWC